MWVQEHVSIGVGPDGISLIHGNHVLFSNVIQFMTEYVKDGDLAEDVKKLKDVDIMFHLVFKFMKDSVF